MTPLTLLNAGSLSDQSPSRLLLCSMTVPWPDRPMQGLYHIDQAKALKKIGILPTILSPAPAVWRGLGTFSAKVRHHLQRPKQYEIDGIQILSPRIRFAFPRWMRLTLAERMPDATTTFCQYGLTSAIEEALQQTQADGLLVHGTLPWAHAASIAAARADIPFSIIEHSFGDITRLRPDTDLAAVYQQAANYAETVFVVSDPMKRHLEQMLGIKNVRVAFNGIGEDAIGIHCYIPKSTDNKPLTLLSAGNYYRRKGFEELVRAFTNLCAQKYNLRLRLITDGSSGLRQIIARSSSRDRIQLLPLCPRENLLLQMQQADLFVMPSWNEAFGMVYAEAMACGTPVIMTESCGMAELINACPPRQEPGIVIKSKNQQALVQCLRVLVTDHERRKNMGKYAKIFAKEHFDWAANAQTIRDGLWHSSAKRKPNQVTVPA